MIKITPAVAAGLSLLVFPACKPHEQQPTSGDTGTPTPLEETVSLQQSFARKFPKLAEAVARIQNDKSESKASVFNIILATQEECKARGISAVENNPKGSMLTYLVQLNRDCLMKEGFYLELGGGDKNKTTATVFAIEDYNPSIAEKALIKELEAPSALKIFSGKVALQASNNPQLLWAGRTVVGTDAPFIIINETIARSIGLGNQHVLANELGNVFATRLFRQAGLGAQLSELFSDLVSLAYCEDPSTFMKDITRIYDSHDGGISKQEIFASHGMKDDAYALTRYAVIRVLEQYSEERTREATRFLQARILHIPDDMKQKLRSSSRTLFGKAIDDESLAQHMRKNPEQFREFKSRILEQYGKTLATWNVSQSQLPTALLSRIQAIQSEVTSKKGAAH